jgi:N-acetylneuraminate synthase
MINNNFTFDDLIVLELANNHWGNVERGLKIISDYGKIVRFNNARGAIKLQFRNIDKFIHKDFKDYDNVRYIKKTMDTKLSEAEYKILTDAVRSNSCLTMATPFDEASVELCEKLDIQIIKIASSDINDWILIEKIAATRKPVIFSTGGTSLKDVDDIVSFFTKRKILFALNHCISLYPSDQEELELNQLDFLRERYPGIPIGFSTHEYNDTLSSSVMMAYAKGARIIERHIDIDYQDIPVSPYCSLPVDIDKMIKAYYQAKLACGYPGANKRIPKKKEIKYLDQLVRGVYAGKDMKAGYTLYDKDVYLAIPLQKGQISCREFMRNEILLKDCKKDQPIMIDDIDSPYTDNLSLKEMIYRRGIDTKTK